MSQPRNVFTAAYLLLLFVFIAVKWHFSSIFAGDTDLWFHLDTGRYILANHHLPHETFWSFIDPPRVVVDYSWLFQVMLYPLFSWNGYYAMVAFRTVLTVAVVLAVLGFMLTGEQAERFLPFRAAVAVIGAVTILPRLSLVRPHDFSYLCIVLFCWILESAPRRAWLLLPLAIVWTNAHGVEYPVMLLILFSYCAEYYADRILKHRLVSQPHAQRIFLAALAALAIYCTPNGLKLLPHPFAMSTKFPVNEFQPIALSSFGSISVVGLMPLGMTLFNLLLVFSILALIASIWKRSFRLSHVLLMAGGLFLVTKGARFLTECLLLLLPILRAYQPPVNGLVRGRLPRPVYLLAVGLIMGLPFTIVSNMVKDDQRYPLSSRGLPAGIVAFLNHAGVGGRVFAHPNYGGYYRWELLPSYKIFMDMQLPLPFTGEDFFDGAFAFLNSEVLRKMLERYKPDFVVTPPVTDEQYRHVLMDEFHYVFVFFDDIELLYVNAALHPDLARQYDLGRFDPSVLTAQAVNEALDNPNIHPFLERLPQMLSIFPKSGNTNMFLARCYLNEEAFDRALPYAETIIRQYPELATGYTLKADALKGLDEPDAALAYYRAALKKKEGINPADIYLRMGQVYLAKGEDKEAYAMMHRGVELFGQATSYQDLYKLGVAAMFSGRLSEAQTAFRYAYRKVPANDTEWYNTLKDLAFPRTDGKIQSQSTESPAVRGKALQ